jgi:hypothetical protein
MHNIKVVKRVNVYDGYVFTDEYRLVLNKYLSGLSLDNNITFMAWLEKHNIETSNNNNLIFKSEKDFLQFILKS